MRETRQILLPEEKTISLFPSELMAQRLHRHDAPGQDQPSGSRKVTDHLANERTFLAWIRTALAIITSGLALGRLEEHLHLHRHTSSSPTVFFQVPLTILGTILMLVALLNFLSVGRAIEHNQFQPQVRFAILLTVISSLIGVTLAFYLITA